MNQKVEGKALMVCDEVTVVILQGPLEGQLAHVPTRKVKDKWDLEVYGKLHVNQSPKCAKNVNLLQN